MVKLKGKLMRKGEKICLSIICKLLEKCQLEFMEKNCQNLVKNLLRKNGGNKNKDSKITLIINQLNK
jgi:hypothetical protein